MTDERLIQALRQGGFFISKSGMIRIDPLRYDAADRLEALIAENEHLCEVAKEGGEMMTKKDLEAIRSEAAAYWDGVYDALMTVRDLLPDTKEATP